MTHNAESEAREKAAGLAKIWAEALSETPCTSRSNIGYHPEAVAAVAMKRAYDLGRADFLASLPGDDAVQKITANHSRIENEGWESPIRKLSDVSRIRLANSVQCHEDRATLLSRDAAHTARIAEWEKVLKPFADACAQWNENCLDDLQIVTWPYDDESFTPHKKGEFLLSDLRNARSALNTGGGE